MDLTSLLAFPPPKDNIDLRKVHQRKCIGAETEHRHKKDIILPNVLNSQKILIPEADIHQLSVEGAIFHHRINSARVRLTSNGDCPLFMYVQYFPEVWCTHYPSPEDIPLAKFITEMYRVGFIHLHQVVNIYFQHRQNYYQHSIVTILSQQTNCFVECT